ncbi:zf-TFIIB domain-containing protein [Streptomyces sp. V4-01]|uniref:Zf-TFIIB domain-containing protein n=1 Tax=Actinacidiphila polyblastidii TaxID=3110430 RepID=A0ABU7PAV4_9ACTN|nr:zf-TFIIB domain-containing protein [Streptomyces sp. V4-01]
MVCPKCHGHMQTYQRNGVQIEQCGNCRGIFLDYGELEALTQLEGRWNQPPAQPYQAAQPYPAAPPQAYPAPPGYVQPAAPVWAAPQHGDHHGGHGHGQHHGHHGFGHMLFSS